MDSFRFDNEKGTCEVLVDHIDRSNLNKFIKDFNRLCKNIDYHFKGDDSEYLFYWDSNKSSEFKNNLSNLYSFLKKDIFLKKQESNSKLKKINEFIKFFENWDEEIDRINEIYVNEECERNKEYFDELKLNPEQRRAIVTDEDSVQIIASAGTGKTTTLISKIKYLIEKKNIEPHKILCLSYNRGTTDNIKDRLELIGIANDEYYIENKVRVSTFHNFGKNFLETRGIISERNNQNNTENFDNNYQFLTSQEVFENYFMKRIWHDIKFLYSLQIVYKDFNKKSFPKLIDHRVIEKKLYYKEETHKNIFETISDNYDPVKSLTDLEIANFLILNNVDFTYFKKYYGAEYKNNKKLLVHFYLPDYDIYIEDFCLDINKRASWLSKSDGREYVAQMNFKKEFCDEKGITLITINSLINKDFLLDLERKLRKEKVALNPLKHYQIRNILYKNKIVNKSKNIKENIIEFLNLFKKHRYLDSYLEDCKKRANDEKERFFLNLVKEYYDYYKTYTESNKYVDFTDMIIKSVNSVHDTDFDYIFVDEYQDITKNRLELLINTKKDSNAKLVVVGDDWQSIYSFQGCNYDYLVKFEKYFPHTKRCDLKRTYRCSNQLIQAAGEFVSADKKLLSKDLYSEKNLSYPIKVIYVNNKNEEKKAVNDILKELVKNENNTEVMILSRFGFILRDTKHFINSAVKSKLNINFETIHGAKGLESQNVIILSVNDEYYGVPSKKSNPHYLRFVTFNDTISQKYEERRLFYVALTRSMNNVFLVSLHDKKSPYINELNSEYIKEFSYNSNVNGEYENFNSLSEFLECVDGNDSSSNQKSKTNAQKIEIKNKKDTTDKNKHKTNEKTKTFKNSTKQIDTYSNFYFEFINNEYKIKICPMCKNAVADDEEECDECGFDFEEPVNEDLIRCPNCFTIINSNYEFCPKCNYDLKNKERNKNFKNNVLDYCCNLIVFGTPHDEAFNIASKDFNISQSEISDWFNHYNMIKYVETERKEIIKEAFDYYKSKLKNGFTKEKIYEELSEIYCINSKVLDKWFLDYKKIK